MSSLLVEGADDGQDESKESMDVDNEGSDADALADYRCGDCGKENPEVSFSGTAMFCCEGGARVWEAGSYLFHEKEDEARSVCYDSQKNLC